MSPLPPRTRDSPSNASAGQIEFEAADDVIGPGRLDRGGTHTTRERRSPIHVQFGKPFYPRAVETGSARQAMDSQVEELMLRIAALLPDQYRGFYGEKLQALTGSGSRLYPDVTG